MIPSDGYGPPDPLAIVQPAQPIPETATMTAEFEALMALPGVVMTGETIGPDGLPAYLVGVLASHYRAAIPASIGGRAVLVEITGDITPY